MENLKVAILSTEESRKFNNKEAKQREFIIEGCQVVVGDVLKGSNIAPIIKTEYGYIPCQVKGLKPSSDLIDAMLNESDFVVLTKIDSDKVLKGEQGFNVSTDGHKGEIVIKNNGVYLKVGIPYNAVLVREINLYK